MICAIYGDLKQAKEFCQYVEQIPLMKLHLDVIIPGNDTEKMQNALIQLYKLASTEEILPNLPLAAGRITLINGFRDLTCYNDLVHDQKNKLLSL